MAAWDRNVPNDEVMFFWSEYYGSDGPITVDTNVVPILPLWFEAGQELGFPAEDPNGFQIESTSV